MQRFQYTCDPQNREMAQNLTQVLWSAKEFEEGTVQSDLALDIER
jgi:hypothetical protein